MKTRKETLKTMKNDENGNNKVGQVGIGFMQALFLLFLGLKLTHVIDWSWWWVTAPLWIPIAVVLFLLGLIYICYYIVDKGSN